MDHWSWWTSGHRPSIHPLAGGPNEDMDAVKNNNNNSNNNKSKQQQQQRHPPPLKK